MLSGGYRRHHTKVYHQQLSLQDIIVTVMQFMLVLCIVGKRASCGNVPPHAMATGHTSKGETLYIGRGNWQGSMTPGKVDPAHGKEISLKQYEVSVLPDIWVVVKNHNVSLLYAVYAGIDSNRDALFVGRANHDGDMLPGKVIVHKGLVDMHIGYKGIEYDKDPFEVLVGHGYSWSGVHSNGNVPSNAVKGGSTSSGETLYIGRAIHANSLTPGKIHPSHKCLYLVYGGREYALTNYEVLVRYNYSMRHI